MNVFEVSGKSGKFPTWERVKPIPLEINIGLQTSVCDQPKIRL